MAAEPVGCMLVLRQRKGVSTETSSGDVVSDATEMEGAAGEPVS